MKAFMRASAVAVGLALCSTGAPAMAAPPAPAPSAPADGEPDFNDTRDQELVSRGFIATRKDPLIRNAKGVVTRNLNEFDFLDGQSVSTINPSLLRQSRLLNKSGLFKVVDGVWQVRNFDIANITFIRGKTGWIVIDPLTAPETAKAAYDLVSEHLGKRPVKAVIYTHSHIDHFGGVAGIVSQADVDAGRTEVIAPAGFMEATVTEWLIAGPAMMRRGQYQVGMPLPRGPEGYVGLGIGQSGAGAWTLIPPTVTIERTGTERVVDGVRLVFQVTPGTEAPAEMNLFIPQYRVLDLAENANPTLHNVLTPRGAEVRDAKGWADHLSESLRLYGKDSDALIMSHGWPRFGNAELTDYIAKHRDTYKFIHDQSVRMMNQGMLPNEIANRLKLPDTLSREWYNRGYYGTVSFAGRAVYQRYMGWYDANPANLAPLEPADEARRYVAAMGGAEKVRSLAAEAVSKGDDRWAAQLYNRLVMSDAGDTAARNELARVYTRLGYAAESSLWRNMYLTGALELKSGISPRSILAGDSVMTLAALPTGHLFDLLATRLDPAKVGGDGAVIDLTLTDRNERVRIMVRNQVLIYDPTLFSTPADATISATASAFAGLIINKVIGPAVKVEGNDAKVRAFANWFTSPSGAFPIVWRGPKSSPVK